MSYLTLNDSAAPSAPAASKMSLYADTSSPASVRAIDSSGNNFSLRGVSNFSVAAQSPAASTRTYITGSALNVPVAKLQVGSCFKWGFNLTKTGAGAATSTFDVCFGTAGTTADTARISFTKPAGTAVIDEGYIEIQVIIRTIGATGVAVGEFWMIHNLSATGHMVIPAAVVNTISAGFDMTVANLIVGVCITSGALDAVTIQQVQAQAWNI